METQSVMSAEVENRRSKHQKNPGGSFEGNHTRLLLSREYLRAIEILTPREVEILKLTAKSRTSKQVAVLMHLSPRTVEKYWENIRSSLGLKGHGSLREWCRLHMEVTELPRREDKGGGKIETINRRTEKENEPK